MPTRKEEFVAIVALPFRLEFWDRALAHDYAVLVGGQKATLSLPRVTMATDSTPEFDRLGLALRWLAGPPLAHTWKRGGDRIEWGSLTSAAGPTSQDRTFVGSVKRCIFTFSPLTLNDHEAAADLHDAIADWIQRFCDLSRIYSQQGTTGGLVIAGSQARSVELFELKTNHLQHVNTQRQENIIIVAAGKDSVLSHDDVRHLVDLCSAGKRLALEHQMLLRAYEAFREQDYRSAVIEATTALEVCLTKRLAGEFERLELPEKLSSELLKKFQTLTGRIELLSLFEVDFPSPSSTYQHGIVHLRNRIIHVGKMVDRSQAFGVLKEVREVMILHSPELSSD